MSIPIIVNIEAGEKACSFDCASAGHVHTIFHPEERTWRECCLFKSELPLAEEYENDRAFYRCPACLAAEKEYKRLKGAAITAEILSDPQEMAEMDRGIEDVKAGRVVRRKED
jgi:hypothetical protein